MNYSEQKNLSENAFVKSVNNLSQPMTLYILRDKYYIYQLKRFDNLLSL